MIEMFLCVRRIFLLFIKKVY